MITGSSSKMLSSEISTNLRGRAYNIEMFTFSFKEYLSLNKIEYESRVLFHKNLVKIKKYFKSYLIEGGYPFIIMNENILKDDILQEYYNSMIFRDVVERYSIKDVKKLQILAKLAFESTSKEITYSKLSKKNEIPWI